jgi:regulator of protease activity HflC (stomatin/prohibitin superfamily)
VIDAAFGWLGQLVEWFGAFVPRWKIIPVTEGGVKYVYGKHVKLVPPGIVWYWPVCTMLETYPTVRQTDNLPSQTLMTADERTITVGGMVIYEVSDVVKLLTGTHSAMRAITDICLAAVHGVCCEMTFDELHAEQRKGTLDTKLKNGAKRQLEDYGVKVLKVQLTDMAPARVIRLVQTTNTDQGQY